jgi:hypothetical protein
MDLIDFIATILISILITIAFWLGIDHFLSNYDKKSNIDNVNEDSNIDNYKEPQCELEFDLN